MSNDDKDGKDEFIHEYQYQGIFSYDCNDDNGEFKWSGGSCDCISDDHLDKCINSIKENGIPISSVDARPKMHDALTDTASTLQESKLPTHKRRKTRKGHDKKPPKARKTKRKITYF